MERIEDLIRRYDRTVADAVDIHIKVKLKMINGLFEEIKDSEDSVYMEEIISQFAEILEWQQDTIDSLMVEVAKADGYVPMNYDFITAPRQTTADIPWDLEDNRSENEPVKELPPYTPPEGGFQTDEQVKKAFTNYLTYHVNRKTKAGKDKPFSIHTIYDYCSRIKVLWEIVCDEWQASVGNSWIQLNAQKVLPGATFLNAYHNISALQAYVERKEAEIREISMGLREPVLADQAQRNPLNNPRNLGNTTAALAKFEEFKRNIDL